MLMCGKQSIRFQEAPYIVSAASVVGSKEVEGPLGRRFDFHEEDDLFGGKTWEEAESNMQKKACVLALQKAHMNEKEIRYLYGGDLLRQGIATSMGTEALQIPTFGLYGACSTSGEALALSAMAVAAGYGDAMLAVTSSHFGSAEKEFRFPLGYANQRPLSAHWTVTGSGAFIVAKHATKKSSEPFLEAEHATKKSGELMHETESDGESSISDTRKSHVRISGVTVGKIVDYGLKDSQNMGACMAPAAMDTILTNLQDFNRTVEEYDRIITGDLGSVGQTLLLDMIYKKGVDLQEKHLDCGMLIFDAKEQDTHAGGSGCGCAAVTLASYILPKLEKGEWKRILFVPTGALMSTVSFNEGASVPGIAHGIVLEHCN